jgi:hypothetical protein
VKTDDGDQVFVLPIEYGHYNLVDDEDRCLKEIPTIDADTDRVHVRVSYGEAEPNHQLDSSAFEINAGGATLATWEYGPPEPAKQLAGPGKWEAHIYKEPLAPQVELHHLTLTPQDERARGWLLAEPSGPSQTTSAATKSADLADNEEGELAWVIKPKSGPWILAAPSYPPVLPTHPAVSLSASGIRLTPRRRAHWIVSASPQPAPTDRSDAPHGHRSAWTALCTWNCGPGEVRIAEQSDGSAGPVVITSSSGMRLTIAVRTETIRTGSPPVLQGAGDIRIHVQRVAL